MFYRDDGGCRVIHFDKGGGGSKTSYTSILEGTGDGMFYIQKEGGAQLLILIREVMTHRHHILAS